MKSAMNTEILIDGDDLNRLWTIQGLTESVLGMEEIWGAASEF